MTGMQMPQALERAKAERGKLPSVVVLAQAKD